MHKCLLSLVGASLLVTAASSPVLADDASPRTIAVTGRAEVGVVPDHVIIRVGLFADSDEAKTAQDEVAKRSVALITYLVAEGVERTDIGTAYVRLNDVRDDRSNRGYRGATESDEQTRFRASTLVQVVIRDLDAYDALLSGMLAVGVNRIDSVEFASSERIEKLREARVLALRAAQEKAEYLAAEIGQVVGKPLQIEADREQRRMPSPINAAMPALAESGAGPDVGVSSISPREITVSAQVHVVFELLDRDD
jgi:hypothetical protein